MSHKFIKKLSLSTGLYRQARIAYRLWGRAEKSRYLSDIRHYSQLLPNTSALCFDVGANTGRITEVLLELGHSVVAFEPQLECIREMTARCNPSKNRLRVKNCAVGDSAGEATLFVREWNGRSSLRQAWEGEISCTKKVPVCTLDNAIQEFGIPQYCKIDVEGWRPPPPPPNRSPVLLGRQ